MNHRIATLLASTTYTADKVEIIDIDVKDPISMIQIFYSAYNTAPSGGSGSTAHPVGCLSKIELVDGSEVIFSLNGFEAQALDFYHALKMPYHNIRYIDNNYSHVVVNLNFGRMLYDELLALDPNQFGNLQLKVTIDEDGGGVAPDAGRMEVLAHVFDQKSISPVGLLIAKEIKSYTLSNNAHEYTDLPTDFPYRKLLVRAHRPGTQPDVQLENFKLSEDTDKRILIDQNIRRTVAILLGQTPPCEENIIMAGNATSTNFHCMPTLGVIITGAGWNTAGQNGIAFYSGDGGRFAAIQASTTRNIQAVARGFCPHGAIEFPMGKQDVPEDWFEVRPIGNLKADLTAGASVGTSQTCELFLQQFRPY